MKKLAIVSSWEEPCGIATYTAMLKPEFEKYFDTTVLKLETDILRSPSPTLSRLGDSLIDQLAATLHGFDYVNIQFEIGLFGTSRNQVYSRLKKLIEASNNLILTLHSISFNEAGFDIKTIFRGNPARQVKEYLRSDYWPGLYKDIALELNRQIKKGKQMKILVHTNRDKVSIQRMLNFHEVYDYPLALYNHAIRSLKKTKVGRVEFLNKYDLSEGTKVIGLFGFVSEYKGHETAIKALRLLPPEYKILIFGAQHPGSIHKYEKINPYLDKLLELIEDYSAADRKAKGTTLFYKRIFFAGAVTDQDFIEAMMYSDFVVLPYMEVGQMGSGVATNALECKANAIFSNTKCFDEMKHYFPNCFRQFDIGNYMELANIILHSSADYTASINHCLDRYNLECNVLNYKFLFEGNADE